MIRLRLRNTGHKIKIELVQDAGGRGQEQGEEHCRRSAGALQVLVLFHPLVGERLLFHCATRTVVRMDLSEIFYLNP